MKKIKYFHILAEDMCCTLAQFMRNDFKIVAWPNGRNNLYVFSYEECEDE